MVPLAARCARIAGGALLALAVSACGSLLRAPPTPPPPDPDTVRARISALLPAKLGARRSDWSADLYSAFEALRIAPSDSNVCAVLAVTEQESGFEVNPTVPNLPTIARREIDERAGRLGIPKFMVSAALALKSPDGRSYRERLEAARTEKALNDLYVDFIDEVPLGRRLFADLNPVRTAGPMQVSIGFAEQHAKRKAYPFPMSGRSLRDEIFTRRGGLYFGIAHLLDYPASYADPLYRFADFNAGHYASRNAAFQNALAIASGRKLALDGDLLIRDRDGRVREEAVGETERAVRSLATELSLDEPQIRRDLERGDAEDFERTRTWTQVFERAEQRRSALGKATAGGPTRLPRALIPKIRLESPKITRELTTEWFARRVATRYHRCLARDAGGSS